MAIRFGGKHSPEKTRTTTRAPEPIRHRLESRPKWVTIAASPFLIGAFFQPVTGMATDLAAFGMVALGMVMTREGLQAEAQYDARPVARRPALPRKLLGGLLGGLGLAVGAAEPGALAGAGLLGVVGVALHWLSFGSDPMADKGMAGIDRARQERVARVVEEGEAYLAQMREAIARTGDTRLVARVDMLAGTAQALFRRVEMNPDDMNAARRFLGVYLMAARDATVKFADFYGATRDDKARQDYIGLIDELARNFQARTRSLAENGRSDFQVELEVLRDSLAREGLAMPDIAASPQPSALPRPPDRSFDDLLQALLKVRADTGR